MANSPAAPLPANLFENVQGQTLGAIIPFAAIATITVVLRFTARRMQNLKYEVDDWLSVGALLFALGCFTLSVKMVQLGSGRHTAVVMQQSPENAVAYLQCLFAYQLLYAHAILFIKGSVLTFYQRVFNVAKFRMYSNIVFGVVAAWYIAVVFVSIFSCNPIYGFWDKTMSPPAVCISSEQFFVGNAIPNIVTDVVIILLPIKMIWNLHVTLAQKVSLSFIFLLGGFTTVSSIVRLVAQFQVSDPDFFWAMNATVIWTSLETSFGVICACLPTLRPLATRLFPRLFSTSTSRSYGRGYGKNNSRHQRKPGMGAYGMNSRRSGFEEIGTEFDSVAGTNKGNASVAVSGSRSESPPSLGHDTQITGGGYGTSEPDVENGVGLGEEQKDGSRSGNEGPLRITVKRGITVDRE